MENRLETFTAFAMQGLCASGYYNVGGDVEAEALASRAVLYAVRTIEAIDAHIEAKHTIAERKKQNEN